MRKLLLLTIVLAAWAFHAASTYLDCTELERLLSSCVFTMKITSEQQQWLKTSGVVARGTEWADSAKAHHGFLPLTLASDYTRELIKAGSKAGIENSFAYRAGLLGCTIGAEYTYHFEEYDSIINVLRHNVEKYINDPVELNAWNLILRSFDLHMINHTASIEIGTRSRNNERFLNSHKNASAEVKSLLYYFTLNSIGYGYYWKPITELKGWYDDINSCLKTIWPIGNDNVTEAFELRKMWSSIAADPDNSLLHVMTLQRLISSDGSMDPIDKIHSGIILSNYHLLRGNELDLRETVTSAIFEAKRQANESAMPVVPMSIAYVLNLQLTSIQKETETEKKIFDEIMTRYGDTPESRRAIQNTLIEYMSVRDIQTKELFTVAIAQRYEELTERETYRPAYFASRINSAVYLAFNGKVERGEEILSQLLPAQNAMEEYQIANTELLFAYNYEIDAQKAYNAALRVINIIEKKHLPLQDELLDVYSLLVECARLTNTHQNEIKELKPKIVNLRKKLDYNPWHIPVDYQLAMLEAYNEPTQSKAAAHYVEIYEKAIKYDFLTEAGNSAIAAGTIYSDLNDLINARKYYDAALSTIISPNYILYDTILDFYYFAGNDRVKWRNIINTITREAEAAQLDLGFSFISMLANQTLNTLSTMDTENFLILSTLLFNKTGIVLNSSTLSDGDFYAKVMICNTMFPLVCKCLQMLVSNKESVQPSQRASYDSTLNQYIELYNRITNQVPQLFEANRVIGVGQCLDNRLTNNYTILAIDGATKAREYLNETEQWAAGQGISNEFEVNAHNFRMHLAFVTQDIVEFERLSQNPQYQEALASETLSADVASWQLNSLIQMSIVQGDFVKAQESVNKQYKIARRYVEEQFPDLNDSQRESLYENGTISTVLMNRVLRGNPTKEAAIQAYNAAVYFKSLFLESKQSLQRGVFASGDSTLIIDFNRLQAMRAKLTKFRQMNSNSEEYMDYVSLLRQANELEDSVRSRASESGLITERRAYEFGDVAKTLGTNEAAIEFIADTDRYGALIIKHGAKMPIYVPLIEGNELNRIVDNMNSGNLATSLKKMYLNSRADGKQLYESIWQPLEPHLEGIKTIFYSPEGTLHKVAFAALQDSARNVLCMKYDLRLVTNTGYIVEQKKVHKKRKANIPHCVAMGGVRYDTDESKKPSRQNAWQYLANTPVEIANFDSICNSASIKPTILSALEPTENAFRAYSGRSPDIMLLATHGFYFSPDEAAILPFYEGKGLTSRETKNQAISVMLRGGVILADANPVWTNEIKRDDSHDGILTAEEISQLDLSNTELMILSACDTGRGETSLLNGVNGLQRGLKLAGVNSIIMSLWKVNDIAGKEFMTEFYSRLFSGVDRHQAFQQARLKLHDAYPRDPAMWAPFIMLD